MQSYLCDERFSRQEIQLLFALRTRMVNVKTNFRNLYENELECHTCEDDESIEDENHLLVCESLSNEDQLHIVKIFKTIL